MIIKKVELQNFGLYYGFHEIDFMAGNQENNVTLIGGLNGRGKTTFLDSITLGLYGRRALKYLQDDANNVIIWKEGTQGYEYSAPVMLQGHIDMVCEKAADCTIDMEKEGLQLVYEDGTISAKGTTLGGDDGIADAYAMALLDSTDISHPPLEAVFTTDEEIGMLGAAAMDI